MSFIDLNYYAEGIQSQSSSWVDKTLPTIMGILIGFGLNRLYDFIKDKKTIKKSGESFLLELNHFKDPLRWILWVGKSVANPAVVKLKSLYRCEFSFNLKYILSTWYLPMSPRFAVYTLTSTQVPLDFVC